MCIRDRIYGWADGQGTLAMFNSPHGVFVDPVSLSVYVGDMNSNRVRKITPTGLVTTIAGSGNGAFVDGQGTTAAFNWPHCVLVDTQGNVYVADYYYHRLRKINPSGVVTTIAGSSVAGGTNGVGTNAQLRGPSDLALESNGRMGYIVEQDGNRIRKIDLSTNTVSTLAGDGVAGFVNGLGTYARFNQPTSAVWHPDGFLYVADGWGGCAGCGNHCIRRIVISSSVVSTFAGNGTCLLYTSDAADE